MKKILVLLLSVFVVMNVFAATGTTVDGGPSEATLKLTLAEQYKFAFIAAATTESGEPTIGTGSETPLSKFDLITDGNALTMSGEGTTLRLHPTQNVFYFYYQAYTNRGDLKIKISAPDNLKTEDSSETIPYTATFYTVSGKWDGENLSPSSITSGSDTSFAKANIKKDSTTEGDDFNYMGLCKVVISSTEDLGKKKPGIYSANIKLTLTAN